MSNWHLTAHELTLITPLLGAPIGAVIALVATSISANKTTAAQKEITEQTLATQRELNRATLQAQSEAAHDQRLWDKRSSVYLEMIKNVREFNSFASDCEEAESWGSYHETRMREIIGAIKRGSPEMVAFAGRNVQGYWGGYLIGVSALSSLLSDYVELESMPNSRLDEQANQQRPAVLAKQRAIILSGLHESGTSTAKLLHLLRAELQERAAQL
jgi:hypothetical protein